MLINTFKTNFFPYVIQVAVILFVLGIFRTAYALRTTGNWDAFLKQFRNNIIAYALIVGSFTIVNFIDKIIAGMH